MTRIDSPCLERSLADKAYDFLGDILLQAETEELLMEIEQEKSSGDTAEMDTFFARQDQHNLQQIQRYFRNQVYNRLFSKTLPNVAPSVTNKISPGYANPLCIQELYKSSVTNSGIYLKYPSPTDFAFIILISPTELTLGVLPL